MHRARPGRPGLHLGEEPITLDIAKIAEKVTLSWPAEAVGFTLQSSPALANPQWAAVSGAVNNSITLPIGANNQFFRLIK